MFAINQRSADVSYLLIEGLVEENHPGDVFLQFVGVRREEQLSVLPPVVLIVLNVYL